MALHPFQLCASPVLRLAECYLCTRRDYCGESESKFAGDSRTEDAFRSVSWGPQRLSEMRRAIAQRSFHRASSSPSILSPPSSCVMCPFVDLQHPFLVGSCLTLISLDLRCPCRLLVFDQNAMTAVSTASPSQEALSLVILALFDCARARLLSVKALDRLWWCPIWREIMSCQMPCECPLRLRLCLSVLLQM